MIPGLEGMAPGAELGVVLASIDVGCLSGYDRVVVLRARQRLVSHYQAKMYEDRVSVADALHDARPAAGDDALGPFPDGDYNGHTPAASGTSSGSGDGSLCSRASGGDSGDVVAMAAGGADASDGIGEDRWGVGGGWRWKRQLRGRPTTASPAATTTGPAHGHTYTTSGKPPWTGRNPASRQARLEVRGSSLQPVVGRGRRSSR